MLGQAVGRYGKEAIQGVGDYIHKAMLPGGEQYDPPTAQSDPMTDPSHPLNQPAKESIPLIQAIDSGYADKKLMTPLQQIRESLASGDMDTVEKGYKKLVDTLSSSMSFGDKFADNYFHQGKMAAIQKMAADVLMKEMMQPPTRAIEATQAGLMDPAELIPGEQMSPQYTHLIPAEPFQMDESGQPVSSLMDMPMPAQPGQQPSGMTLDPNVKLTPLQESLVDARIKAQTHARQPQSQRALTPTDLALAGLNTSLDVIRAREGREPTNEEKAAAYKEWSGLQGKEDTLELKKRVEDSLSALRAATATMRGKYGDRAERDMSMMDARERAFESRARLDDARAEYIKSQPKLQRDLQAMKSKDHPQHEVFQAISRVREAIANGKQPDAVDAALFKSYLMRGGAEYRANFLGKLFDAYTGEYVSPELKDADMNGIVGTLKKYLGNLFGMLSKDAEENMAELDAIVPEGEMPSPKTPEEAAKLKPGTRYKTPDGKVMVR
jgi:hypothetical protein